MSKGDRAIIGLDMGTTRTRAWLVEQGKIWARDTAEFGVRDLVSGQKTIAVRHQLAELLASVESSARERGFNDTPECVVSAGMIGAPQGILSVPHIAAPAGIKELSRGIQNIYLPEITVLPLYIIPGVRIQQKSSAVAEICEGDLIRGEESLCMGLAALQLMKDGDMLLNLGSHWKWIGLDEQCRIATSRTSLTGEMIHSIQSNTLLASALPQQRPERIDHSWLQYGMDQVKKEGLSRTLFCVRLLELAATSTPEERLSFLYGAFIQDEISSLTSSAFFGTNSPRRVLISGPAVLATAWQKMLARIGWESIILSDFEIEEAYLLGLKNIAAAMPNGPISS